MELRDYLHMNRMTAVEFSKKIDYDAAYIRLCNTSKLIPGKKFIKIVEKATDGLVKFEDWKKDVDENELSA